MTEFWQGFDLNGEPHTSSDATPKSLGERPPRVVEVLVDRPLGRGLGQAARAGATSLAALVVVFVVWVALFPTTPMPGSLSGAAVIVGMSLGGPCDRAYHRLTARLVRRFDRTGGDQVAARLTSVFRGYRSSGEEIHLRQLASALFANGERGLLLVIRTADEPPLGTPIDVPFEPRRLEDVGSILADDDPWRELEQRDREHERRRLIPVAVLAMLAGVGLIGWVVWKGGPWFGSGVLTSPVLLAAIVGSLFSPLLFLGRECWLAVPGAVACLSSRWWEATWRVRLHRRGDSVLIVAPRERGVQVVAIASCGGSDSTVCASENAYILLRAFRSSIEPPRVEWLSNPS